MNEKPPPLSPHPTHEEFDRAYEYFTEVTYKTFAKLVARAWADPEFDRQLRANPAQVMRDEGIDLPDDLHISPEQFFVPERPQGVAIEHLLGGQDVDMLSVSCAGSASSFSCPGCTASTFGSGGC